MEFSLTRCITEYFRFQKKRIMTGYNSSWEECPICLEDYNPEEKLPTVWHRTHLACRECFRQMKDLRCVFCRSETDSLYEATEDDMCAEHTDQLVSYYCTQHSTVICNVCIQDEHLNCDCENLFDIKAKCQKKLQHISEELVILKEYVDQRITNIETDRNCLKLFEQAVISFITEHMPKAPVELKIRIKQKIQRHYKAIGDAESLTFMRDSLQEIYDRALNGSSIKITVQAAKDAHLAQKVNDLKSKVLRLSDVVTEKILQEIKKHDENGLLNSNVYFPVLKIVLTAKASKQPCLTSLTTDDIGNVYVSDTENGCVHKFNRNGAKSTPQFQLQDAASGTRAGLAIDHNKKEMLMCIKKWDSNPSGRFLTTNVIDIFCLQTGDFKQTIPVTQFSSVYDLAVTKKGEIAFSDPVQKLVAKINRKGKVIQAFSNQPENLSTPGEVCLGPNEEIITSDKGVKYVHVYRQDGANLCHFIPKHNAKDFTQISSLSVNKYGNIFVSGTVNNVNIVKLFSMTGDELGFLAGTEHIGRFGGITVATDDRVWVLDVKNCCVIKYKSVTQMLA